MSRPIRVRFAPSPTGPLHIGSVRTALFNFLFAKHGGGQFLLRIEDTDRERSRPEFEQEILELLQWVGLAWDGPVARQSERLSRYQAEAERLLKERRADRVTENGKTAVRFRMPKKQVGFDDLVHGRIEFDSSVLEELIIQKSDGFPTYHFACVVDDHEMSITHVIRGDDHISNTPKQLLLYEALGYEPPVFAHVPLVFGADRAPLSKRNANVSFRSYREAGYLPGALVNYLALLGWSPAENRELMAMNDLIREFSVKRLHKTNACFDENKLKWLNSEHLRALSDEAYLSRSEEWVRAKGWRPLEGIDFHDVALLFKNRIQSLGDLETQAAYFFTDEITVDSKAVRKYLKGEETRGALQVWARRLEEDGDFSSVQTLETLLRDTADQLKKPAKALIHPTRVAITGRSVSPGLFDVMKILGKEKTLKRLTHAIDHFFNLENARGA